MIQKTQQNIGENKKPRTYLSWVFSVVVLAITAPLLLTLQDRVGDGEEFSAGLFVAIWAVVLWTLVSLVVSVIKKPRGFIEAKHSNLIIIIFTVILLIPVTVIGVFGAGLGGHILKFHLLFSTPTFVVFGVILLASILKKLESEIMTN